MKIVPHGVQYTGFFDEIDIEKLANVVQDFLASIRDCFSMEVAGSELFCFCQLETNEENVSPESHGASVLLPFIEELRAQPWIKCKIDFWHGMRFLSSRMEKTEPHRGEIFTIAIDREAGVCEIQCRLREIILTEPFTKKVIEQLGLFDRPKKHSRDIPEKLETELLCDSLHLCNVCRQECVIIHHIDAVENGGKTVEENLIVLCLKHHGQAHSKSTLTKGLKPEHLREYKSRHALWVSQQGVNASMSQISTVGVASV
jgi:hypothetical protein